MLNKLIYAERIKIVKSISNWDEAIYMVCEPLLKDKTITVNYRNEILRLTKKQGFYYSISPKIAMPHAKPEMGVNRDGISLLVIKNGIHFNQQERNHDDRTPVQLFLLLAATLDQNHIKLISSLSKFLSNNKDTQSVINSKTTKTIENILLKY